MTARAVCRPASTCWVGGDRGQAVDIRRRRPPRRPATIPTSANKRSRASFNRLLHPDTTDALELYHPATNTWSSGPSLNHPRSNPAATHVGNTAIAVGGYSESGPYITNSVEINVTGGGCASPTPIATATATPTPAPAPHLPQEIRLSQGHGELRRLVCSSQRLTQSVKAKTRDKNTRFSAVAGPADDVLMRAARIKQPRDANGSEQSVTIPNNAHGS